MDRKLKKLPIGIHTLSEIIEENYLYVDKTKYVFNLISEGKTYFLSRPRRFGKSLLITTLEEIFKGNKDLFKGLWIHDSDWKWEKFPVIRMDFSKQNATQPDDLIAHITKHLNLQAAHYGISLSTGKYYEQFEQLIRELSAQGKVVILIDEYDKPIIDHLTNIPLAKQMRDILKGFYTVMKGMDAHLKFVLLTGVSKFSKAGVFSELNHLDDITMNPNYSGMLGITQHELECDFAQYIELICEDRKWNTKDFMHQMQEWYNGYCFSDECTRVYNPFSVLLFFRNKRFSNYWFESGTPTFLIDIMKSKNYSISEIPTTVEAMSFSTYELENLDIIPLLFQTGYLTLKTYHPDTMLFTLDYPNLEVKKSFLSYILKAYSRQISPVASVYLLIAALRSQDFDKFFQIMKSFFKEIPYDLHLDYEKYYQTIFYTIFQLMGLEILTEFKLSDARIDVVVKDSAIFILEFKFNQTKEVALQQIKEKKYFEPWLNKGKDIYLAGVNFQDKNIEGWVVEKV